MCVCEGGGGYVHVQYLDLDLDLVADLEAHRTPGENNDSAYRLAMAHEEGGSMCGGGVCEAEAVCVWGGGG